MNTVTYIAAPGIMEWWNIGTLEKPKNITQIFPKPLFQHSNIPVFQLVWRT